jgi:hypothetical protein
MSCDSFRELLLDFDWDESTRRRAAELLKHMETCRACQDAARDLDRLRAILRTDSGDIKPDGGWAGLEQRLTASAHPKRPVWRFQITAIAASLLIATVSFQFGRLANRSMSSTLAVGNASMSVRQPDAPTHFRPQEIVHDVSAFGQISKVFDGRASWMLVSDEASDVGLLPHDVAEARKVLLLRLRVTRGSAVLSNADLLVIPGQSANLTVPLKGGHSLHYRIGTSTDEPTRLSVSLELATPNGNEPLAALSTNLQVEPGQTITAGQLATSAGEYQLKISFAREDLPQNSL